MDFGMDLQSCIDLMEKVKVIEAETFHLGIVLFNNHILVLKHLEKVELL